MPRMRTSTIEAFFDELQKIGIEIPMEGVERMAEPAVEGFMSKAMRSAGSVAHLTDDAVILGMRYFKGKKRSRRYAKTHKE